MHVTDLQGIGLHVPYDQMDPLVIAEVKCRLMDGIIALAGGALSVRKESLETLCAVAKAEPEVRPVFPVNMRTSLEMAAFLNAFFIRSADWGDTFRRDNGIGGHPSDQVAAILALCDAPDVSGRLIIELMHLAYQFFTLLQVRMFATQPTFDYTSTLSLTTPVLAAVRFGASPERVQAALNLSAACGAMLGQVRPSDITNMKSGASACTISGGFRCYRLSEALKAPASIFEGKWGWYKLIAPLEGGLVTIGNDATYMPSEVKTFPCFHVGQTPVECAVALYEQIGAAGGTKQIKSVAIHVSEIDAPYIDLFGKKQFPENQSEADHHLIFCLAIALRCGALTPLHYSDAYFGDTEIRRLISITEVQSQPFDTADQEAQKGACRLEVMLKNGKVLQESRLRAEGTFYGLSSAERLAQLKKVVDRKRSMLEKAGRFDFSPVSNSVDELEKYDGRTLLDLIHKVLSDQMIIV